MKKKGNMLRSLWSIRYFPRSYSYVTRITNLVTDLSSDDCKSDAADSMF